MMGEAGWVMLVTNQYISVTQGNVLRSPYCKNELFAFVWLRTLTNQDLSLSRRQRRPRKGLE